MTDHYLIICTPGEEDVSYIAVCPTCKDYEGPLQLHPDEADKDGFNHWYDKHNNEFYDEEGN